jgi:uncharacterized membrane protein YjjB (DUF3815 family)
MTRIVFLFASALFFIIVCTMLYQQKQYPAAIAAAALVGYYLNIIQQGFGKIRRREK